MCYLLFFKVRQFFLFVISAEYFKYVTLTIFICCFSLIYFDNLVLANSENLNQDKLLAANVSSINVTDKNDDKQSKQGKHSNRFEQRDKQSAQKKKQSELKKKQVENNRNNNKKNNKRKGDNKVETKKSLVENKVFLLPDTKKKTDTRELTSAEIRLIKKSKEESVPEAKGVFLLTKHKEVKSSSEPEVKVWDPESKTFKKNPNLPDLPGASPHIGQSVGVNLDGLIVGVGTDNSSVDSGLTPNENRSKSVGLSGRGTSGGGSGNFFGSVGIGIDF